MPSTHLSSVKRYCQPLFQLLLSHSRDREDAGEVFSQQSRAGLGRAAASQGGSACSIPWATTWNSPEQPKPSSENQLGLSDFSGLWKERPNGCKLVPFSPTMVCLEVLPFFVVVYLLQLLFVFKSMHHDTPTTFLYFFLYLSFSFKWIRVNKKHLIIFATKRKTSAKIEKFHQINTL